MRWKLKIATFVCAVAFAAAESPRLDGFLDDFSLISGKLTTSNKRITRRGIEDFDTADITRTTIYYKDLALTMTLSPDHLLVSSKLTINTNHFLKGSLDFIPNSIVRLNLIPGTDSFEGIIHFGELNFGPLFIDSLSRFSNVSTHPATHHSVIYSLGDLSHKSRPSNHRNNIFNNHLVRRSNRKHLSKRRAAAATLTVEDLKQIIALAILKDVNPSVSSNGLIRPSSSSSSPITATIATTTSSTKLIPSLPPVKIVSVTPVAPTTTTTTPAPPPPPPSPPPPPPSPSPTSSAHSSPQPQGICKAAVIADNSFFEGKQAAANVSKLHQTNHVLQPIKMSQVESIISL